MLKDTELIEYGFDYEAMIAEQTAKNGDAAAAVNDTNPEMKKQ